MFRNLAILTLVALTVLLVPAGAGAQSVRAPRLHTLENGLRVLTVEDRANPIVTVTWSAALSTNTLAANPLQAPCRSGLPARPRPTHSSPPGVGAARQPVGNRHPD